GLLSFLSRTRTEAAATGAALQTTAAKVATAKTTISTASTAAQIQLPWADNMRGKGPVQGVLPLFDATPVNRSVDAASGKVTGLKGRLASLPRFVSTTVRVAETGLDKAANAINRLPTGVKVFIAFEMVNFTIQQVLELMELMKQYRTEQKNLDSAGKLNLGATQKAIESFKPYNEKPPASFYKGQARSQLSLLQEGDNKYLENFLHPERQGWYSKLFTLGANPFNKYGSEARGPYMDRLRAGDPGTTRWRQSAGSYAGFEKEVSGSIHMKNRAPELGIAEVMKEFRRQIAELNLSADAKASVDRMLEAAFPQSFKDATQQAAAEFANVGSAASMNVEALTRMYGPTLMFTEGLEQLNSQASPLAASLKNTQTQAGLLPPAFNRVGNAANTLADRIANVQITPPTFSVPSVPQGGAANPIAPGFNFKLNSFLPSAQSQELRQVNPNEDRTQTARAALADAKLYSVISSIPRATAEPRNIQPNFAAPNTNFEFNNYLPSAQSQELKQVNPQPARAALAAGSKRDIAASYEGRPKRENNFYGDIKVQVPAGSRAADDPHALAALIGARLESEAEAWEERA
nr:hypothetical protein [Acidobacteriota bacterium]